MRQFVGLSMHGVLVVSHWYICICMLVRVAVAHIAGGMPIEWGEGWRVDDVRGIVIGRMAAQMEGAGRSWRAAGGGRPFAYGACHWWTVGGFAVGAHVLGPFWVHSAWASVRCQLGMGQAHVGHWSALGRRTIP